MINVTISESYPPLSEEDVSQFERELGIDLPDDYRQFLLTHNGGRPEPEVFPVEGDPDASMVDWFLGIQEGAYEDLRNHLKVFRDRVPPELLPIARDPGDNLIYIAVLGPNRGRVNFWDHEEEVEEGETPDYRNVSLVAHSFEDFLHSLTPLHLPE